MSHFSYIITAHNSEALIESVLDGVLSASREWSKPARSRDRKPIVCVLDGCTDRTESIVDGFISGQRRVPIAKVHTPDVHELLSINAGLRAAPQDGGGYNIILQDDVILEDPDLEAHVEHLYAAIPQLGYVSFRLGFNLSAVATLSEGGYFNQIAEIESAYGNGVTEDFLLPGIFAPRTVPIKSPVCLPCKLVREIGLYNEDLAPYGYDDVDMAIRCAAAGYQNGVFSIPLQHDLRWGGTRKPGHADIMPTARRNAALIEAKYRIDIDAITYRGQPTTERDVLLQPLSDDEVAMKRWNASKALLKEMNP